MPPTLADRLSHILEAINTIQTALAKKTLPDFANDVFLRLAIERALEIISEASRNIPNDVKTQQPQIDWPGMADFGNCLRHAYHRVDPAILWQIVEDDLPPLKAFVDRIVRQSER